MSFIIFPFKIYFTASELVQWPIYQWPTENRLRVYVLILNRLTFIFIIPKMSLCPYLSSTNCCQTSCCRSTVECWVKPNNLFFNFLPLARFRVREFSNLPLHLRQFAFHQSLSSMYFYAEDRVMGRNCSTK